MKALKKLEPNKCDRKKFDLDLKFGKIGEKKVAEMLLDGKIEVKSEKDIWQKSGNLCIEYESYGKPSGIKATESDYWFHNLFMGDDIYATIVFRTDTIRKIIASLDYVKTVSGGDHYASKMYLLNIQKLFSSDVVKTFKDNK